MRGHHFWQTYQRIIHPLQMPLRPGPLIKHSCRQVIMPLKIGRRRGPILDPTISWIPIGRILRMIDLILNSTPGHCGVITGFPRRMSTTCLGIRLWGLWMEATLSSPVKLAMRYWIVLIGYQGHSIESLFCIAREYRQLLLCDAK